MPDKIWAVSSGSYSDYRVHAIFATKALADQATEIDQRAYGEAYFVEEIPYFTEPARKAARYSIRQELRDDGQEGDVCFSEEHGPEFDMLFGPVGPRPTIRAIRAPMHNGRGCRLEIDAATPKARDKAHHDALMEWRALNERQRQFWKQGMKTRA